MHRFGHVLSEIRAHLARSNALMAVFAVQRAYRQVAAGGIVWLLIHDTPGFFRQIDKSASMLDEAGTGDGVDLGESGADSEPIEATIFAIPYGAVIITDPHPIGVVGGGVDNAGGDACFTELPRRAVTPQALLGDPEQCKRCTG